MTTRKDQPAAVDAEQAETPAEKPTNASKDTAPKEIGGRAGPEPTRYGDWEKNGIISDF